MMPYVNEYSDGGNSLAFKLLIFFTLILYLSPQSYIHFLQVLHLARTSAILGIMAFLLRRKGAAQQSLNSDEKAVAVFSILVVISIPLSLWKAGSFEYFIEIYSKVIIIFYLMSRLITSVDKMKTMISVLVWCSVFFAVVAVGHYSHQIYLKGNRIGGPDGAMAEDPNDLALCLVMMIPFAWARYRLAEKKSERMLNLGIIVLYFAGIIVSFSRGGFLGLLTVLVLGFMRLSGSNRLRALSYVGVIIVTASFFVPQNYFVRAVSIVDSQLDETGSADVRFDDMKYSVAAAFKRPVFGVGIGMNTLALQDAGKINYWKGVHSAPLQVASELGFPALCVYVYLFFVTNKTMTDIRKNQSFKEDGKRISTYAGAIEVSLWGFVVSGFFLPVAYRWYSFYIIGLGSALINILNHCSHNQVDEERC